MLAFAQTIAPHPVGNFRRASRRWRMGRLPPCAARSCKAAAVGAGSDGNPRKRANPPSRLTRAQPHPCRDARRSRRAMGNGGGLKMRRALRRHRRDLGRSQSARLHRHAAARRRVRAVWRGSLHDSAGRPRQFERGAHAMADRERAVSTQCFRSEGAGAAGMGCRAVPRPGNAAGPLEHRP